MRTYGLGAAKAKKGSPGSAGQSGDTQGLPDAETTGSESVLELTEEGQTFEAEILLGVKEAAEAGVAEVHTKQVPEDRVPVEDAKRLGARKDRR